MQVDNPQASSSCSVPNKLVEAAIHLLVNELMNTTKLINETPSASIPDSDNSSARRDTVGDGATSRSESSVPAFPVDVQDKHQYLCL